jgi:hypothetical protein
VTENKKKKLEVLPVLVEASAAVLAQVLGEDSLEGAQALGRLDIADGANDDHWRRLDDCDGLDGLLLVQLGAQLVHLAHNVGHARLVADEGGQVDGLAGVVLGEGLYLAAVAARALLRQKSQRTTSGMFKFTMTLFFFC